MKRIKLIVENRQYTSWKFCDPLDFSTISIDETHALKMIDPLKEKHFMDDVFEIRDIGTPTENISFIHSMIRSGITIAGILQLDNNRTYGRDVKNRLLYKCIPDDIHLPHFLVPYDIKQKFSKAHKNKYIVFSFSSWDKVHPIGIIRETLGDVDNLDMFYEYQLYCKRVHVSLTEFSNKTRVSLREKTNDDYIKQIENNPKFNIIDRRSDYVFTVDPKNSGDLDDGLSIIEMYNDLGEQIGWKVSVYIANIYVWLETLGLWNAFSKRVSSIYLPDRKRPMLPTVLSDNLCSLRQNTDRFVVATDFFFDCNGAMNGNIQYHNAVIHVSHNYAYEESKMTKYDVCYKKLFALTELMDKSVRNSHDLVSFWMVQLNAYTGLSMMGLKTGIFRSVTFNVNEKNTVLDDDITEDCARIIRTWNNTTGHYLMFDDKTDLNHELMNITSFKKNSIATNKIKAYIHISSPIRRLVDLLNQMILLDTQKMITERSDDATNFYNGWVEQLEYINRSMRLIRKVQVDCEVVRRCFDDDTITRDLHRGIVFDKIVKNNGLICYMVYLEDIKLLSRITTTIDMPNNTYATFNVFLFEDEDKVRRKIRLSLID